MPTSRNDHHALLMMLSRAGIEHRGHTVCDDLAGNIHDTYQGITLAIGDEDGGPCCEFRFTLEGKLEHVAIFGHEAVSQ